MEQFKTQIDRLAELNEEELSSLDADIRSAFNDISDTPVTQESVQQMTELADMLETVHGEGARRKAEAETLKAAAEAAAARVHGTEDVEDEVVEDDVVVEEETPEDEDEPVVAAADSEDAVEEIVAVEEFAAEAEAEASVEVADEAEAAVETPVEAEASVEEVTVEAEASVEEAEIVEAEAPAEAEAAVEVEEIAEASVSEVSEIEAPAEAEASVVETTIESLETQEEAQTVTASVEEAFEAPADRRPMAQVEESRTAITAGADIPGVAAGSTLSNANEVAEAFVKRLDTLRRVNGGDGEQTIVASIVTEYDESRQLFGTGDQNWEKMVAARDEQQALVASGGVGTPFPVKYDIFGFGTDARPVKNSLPKFQADRGGIRFVKPPVLSSYADAVGIWTNQNDIDAADNDGSGTDTVKNVLVVSGAQEVSAGLDAVTVQLQIGNLLSRAYPELVARHNELALIQHAREAELNLLAKINAASTQVTTSGVIGVARDFLVNVRRAAAAYRSRHRISPDTRLQAIIPSWIVEAMASDLVLNMPGDNNLDAGRAEINALLAKVNVSLVESLDQNTFGAQSAGALLEFPDSFTWFLFSEGSFLFLDGGTLDLGIVRDSALVGTNDYRMFVETFEGLAFVGIESLAITSTVAVNGTAAALIDTTGGATASVIEY